MVNARYPSAGPRQAVVGALPEEVATLLARGRKRRLPTAAGRFFHLALGQRQPLIVGWTGDGAGRAGEGLERLLQQTRIGSLVLVGVAGALTPGLEPGQLIVARQVRDPSGAVPSPDGALLERALLCRGTVAGMLLSSDRIATTTKAKAELLHRLGGDAPAAVDLETAAWVRIAAARGVPYVAVRAISDTAAESLPLDFNRWLDARGSVRRSSVVLHALRHPGTISELRALRRRIQLCAGRVAGFVEHFVL